MDWNEDGKKDLVVGDTNGRIHIYINNGTDASPLLAASTYLQVGGVTFDCGYRSMPEIVDWNNDGKKDVLCGDDEGRVNLLINTGTNSAPAFAAKVYLQDGTSTLDVGSGYARSGPVVVDWNRDGKKDLLSGRYDGRVVFYENKGTDADPVFQGSTLLRAGGSTIDAGYYSRIEVHDWNSDGEMDLLVGNRDYSADNDGKVFLFRAVPPSRVTRWELYR